MKVTLTLGLIAAGVYALVLRRHHRMLCRDVGAHYMEAILS